MNFCNQNIYVGLDVHLKNWKVTITTENTSNKTFSHGPKPEVLYQYLKRNFPNGNYYSAYEAGFCGYWIHHKLLSFGINSIVVNPADIPTTNKEKVQKDDKRDSRKIARELRNGDLVPIYVPSSKTLEDRGLLRTRCTLVKDLKRNKNQIKSFLYFHGIEIPEPLSKSRNHWSKKFFTWLENIEISEESGKESLIVLIGECRRLRVAVLDLTRQIRKLSQTKSYHERVKLLTSIPGIGLITAMIILTELENMDRFNNLDKLSGFVGLVPSTSSSSEKDKTGDLTPRGHSILRTAIIENSWIAVRNDPALLKSYLEYCRRMDPNKAIIRIAKKLLSRIRFVLRNNMSYECSVVR